MSTPSIPQYSGHMVSAFASYLSPLLLHNKSCQDVYFISLFPLAPSPALTHPRPRHLAGALGQALTPSLFRITGPSGAP